MIETSRNVPFIDGGVFLGVDARTGLDGSLGQLAAMMDDNGVDAALAVSFAAVAHDQENGNNDVLTAARALPGRIIPAAAVSPLSYLPRRGVMDGLAEKGFPVVGLFPHHQRWPTDLAIVRTMIREAGRASLAVQCSVADFNDLSGIARAARETDTPVLVRWVRGGGYLYQTEAIALGFEIENLYFDIGTMTTTGGIANMAEALGANRLYLASGFPLTYEHCAYFRAALEEMNEEDRALVMGGSLARALGLTPPLTPASRNTREELVFPKIDVHWHEGSWNVLERGVDMEGMDRLFTSTNIRYAFVSSITAILSDLRAGNEAVDRLSRTDKRVLGLCVVSPVNVEESLREIDRWLVAENTRFVGLKTAADYFDTTIADPRYAPILDKANSLGLVLLTHKYALEEIASLYPQIKFIAAHSMIADVRRLARFPNVYFEPAASYCRRDETDMKAMVAEVGSNRILFGSDGPLIHPSWSMGKLAGLSCKDKQHIYYDNAFALIRMMGLSD